MKNLENNKDWNEAKASGGFEGLPAGGYVCCITDVEDIADKEYLKIKYDIVTGEYAGYWQQLYDAKGFWGGTTIRSYKPKAMGMFKGFLKSIENSKENKGFEWKWNEKDLLGRVVGLVLGEEEYIKNNGEVGTRIVVKSVKTVEDIQAGKFKMPEKKCIEEQKETEVQPPAFEPSDIPF